MTKIPHHHNPHAARPPATTKAPARPAARAQTKKASQSRKPGELTEEEMSEQGMDTGDDNRGKQQVERDAEFLRMAHNPSDRDKFNKTQPKEGDAPGAKSAVRIEGINSPVHKPTASAQASAPESKAASGSGSAAPPPSAAQAPTSQSVPLGTPRASPDKTADKASAAPPKSFDDLLAAEMKAKSAKRASEAGAATETQRSGETQRSTSTRPPMNVRSSSTAAEVAAKRAANAMTLPPQGKGKDARTMLASGKPAGTTLKDYVASTPQQEEAARSAEAAAQQSIKDLKASGKLRPEVDVQTRLRETAAGPFLVLEPNARLKLNEFNALPMKADDFRTLVVLDFNKPLKKL